ncbi:alginate lyase family protein [Pseudodesulfovibrio sediminis]|uniref:Alginate lyase n=1 Tax=Pseudodesulfovibrio sediminis TaxID=2810563 RepID=A0ABM7P5I4_9BACT|nr:alginate lyase family protein [Pseudodesulfovibrio sediminis]BCS88187.1 alginate lyase [Pseudodesulfovibrio sediminis]
MIRPLVYPLFFLLFAAVAVPLANAGQTLPDTVVLSPQVLHATKQRVLKRDPAVRPAYEQFMWEAEQAVKAPIESPTFKGKTGPSRDNHDYWSISPYWWPDPKKQDGLPFIRRDGQRNPETASDTYDRTRLNRMSKNALTLALAYYLTGNEVYATRATALIKAWCVDPATKANPNMRYAQARPGISDGQPTGIIETRDLILVVDAVRLLEHSRAWGKADTRKVETWFSHYTDWLMHSEFGRKEAGSPNNHGTWFDAQVAVFAYFTGDKKLANTVVGTTPTRRIVRQIMPDGSMPLELERTRSRQYTFFNLEAFFVLAAVGERLGVDLWNWKDPVGPSIRQALDFAASGIDPSQEWPHGRTGAFNPYVHVPLFRRAAVVYKDKRYIDFLKTLPADRLTRDRSFLFY